MTKKADQDAAREAYRRRQAERIRDELGHPGNQAPVIGVGWYRDSTGKVRIA